jgi:hypothetical protein
VQPVKPMEKSRLAFDIFCRFCIEVSSAHPNVRTQESPVYPEQFSWSDVLFDMVRICEQREALALSCLESIRTLTWAQNIPFHKAASSICINTDAKQASVALACGTFATATTLSNACIRVATACHRVSRTSVKPHQWFRLTINTVANIKSFLSV